MYIFLILRETKHIFLLPHNKVTEDEISFRFDNQTDSRCVHAHTYTHGLRLLSPGHFAEAGDAKSAILSESLDSFSWGTWCHPSRMSFSRQRGKPTRQKRLITLSNLLTNSTQLVDRHYSHFSVRAATTLRVSSIPLPFLPLPNRRAFCTCVYIYTRTWHQHARVNACTHAHKNARVSRWCRAMHGNAHTRAREHTTDGHVCYWSFNEGTE